MLISCSSPKYSPRLSLDKLIKLASINKVGQVPYGWEYQDGTFVKGPNRPDTREGWKPICAGAVSPEPIPLELHAKPNFQGVWFGSTFVSYDRLTGWNDPNGYLDSAGRQHFYANNIMAMGLIKWRDKLLAAWPLEVPNEIS